jgi:predicted peroxiredoxin
MSKIAIVCSGCEPSQLFPTFVFAASAAALGDEVIIFCCPAAAPAMLKGHLEGMQAKGMPPMADLLSSFDAAGGRIMVCELALEAKDLTTADLREEVEVVGVTAFLVESADASRTFCF